MGLNAASANATVKLGDVDVDVDQAGVTTLVPGVNLYQINDKALDVQANWGGIKYFKDSDLN